MDRPPADRLVVVCILLLLLVADLLNHLRLSLAACAWLAHPGLYAPACCIGGLVGFAELVSRYRDAPWAVAVSPPGLIFIGLNAFAAALALFLFDTFPDQLHAPSHPVMKVILAGTGAMVAVRTKIFTIRQPSGTDIAVGPAFVLDTMLSAVNRAVDRRRAQARITKVARCASRLAAASAGTYAQAHEFLIASLGAFQNLDPDVSKKLSDALRLLVDDMQLKLLPDEVKFLIAGYSVLTEFGDRAFDAVFASLDTYLGVKPVP
jgi:hypothetical protein